MTTRTPLLPRRPATATLPLLLALLASGPALAEEADPRFWSAEDGQLDVSGFLDQAYGFLPIVIPITEPAVGYGAVGAVAFIDKPKQEDARAGFGRPNITVVGALGTENGTRGGFVSDIRHWMDDRLKTVAVLMQASVNLDFYGVGRVPALQDAALAYNLDTRLGLLRGQYRLGETPWWAGLGYVQAATKVRFESPFGTPGLPAFENKSNVGGLLPMISYDSRQPFFTPSSGSYLELSGGIFSKSLGSDHDFQRYDLTAMHYMPLASKWSLGLFGSATSAHGEVPFYMQPYISMRGVPAMRYQGEQVAQTEAEVRWQFWQRYSLVAFAGGGVARADSGRVESQTQVLAGGLGFRYEIARKYGLHLGLDVAHSRDDNAIYVTVGSAWMRP